MKIEMGRVTPVDGYGYQGIITLVREPEDPKYYGAALAKGESLLLYALRKKLRPLGLKAVKLRMAKDGHLVDDMKQYVRSGDPRSYWCIYNERWSIEGAEEDWNRSGKTELTGIFDHPESFRAALEGQAEETPAGTHG